MPWSTRPMEAYLDLERLLRAGRNVVSTSFYPLLHPASAPAELMGMLDPAMQAGNSSVFVSGIDPGWALDILPGLVSGVGAGITEIRTQEIFNDALYDQPDVVRNMIGLGEPGAAGGGNASAANRVVNAIPAVCAAPAGALSPLDLPPISGAAQLRLG